jgi:hypothetical protein
MEKYLKVQFSNGDIFVVPAKIIAENRADYYSALDGYDKGTNEWEAEVQNGLNEEFEIYDWAGNNMNWEDLAPYAKKIEDLSDYDYEDEWPGAEIEICED